MEHESHCCVSNSNCSWWRAPLALEYFQITISHEQCWLDPPCFFLNLQLVAQKAKCSKLNDIRWHEVTMVKYTSPSGYSHPAQGRKCASDFASFATAMWGKVNCYFTLIFSLTLSPEVEFILVYWNLPIVLNLWYLIRLYVLRIQWFKIAD